MLSIVVPTYNEAENIEMLIHGVKSSVKNTNYEIVIVDDNSPDRTWAKAVIELKNTHNLIVVRRINIRGLATAVVDGIAFSKGKYTLVMDADLQHPPEYIPKMLNTALENDADIVVGSRYIKGGGIEGWSFHRLLISKIAALIAKLLLPEVRKLSDPMSGFFLVRKEIVDKYRDELNPKGFKILLEILVKCRYGSVVECPYVFKPRLKGRSKLGYREIINFLMHILKLSKWRPLKFASVGALGTIVNLSTLYLLGIVSPFLLSEYFVFGSAIAIETSTIFNFVLHDIWTFKDRRYGSIFLRLALFHLAVIPAISTQYIVSNVSKYILNFNPFLSQFTGIVLGFVVNYVLSELGVWKKR